MLICISKLMNVCRALWDAQMKGSGEAQRYYYCHLLIKMFPHPLPLFFFFKHCKSLLGSEKHRLPPSQQAAAIFPKRKSCLLLPHFAFSPWWLWWWNRGPGAPEIKGKKKLEEKPPSEKKNKKKPLTLFSQV